MALNIIQTPEAKKKINDKLTEISASKTRAAAERDLQKTIVADLAEEYEIEKKLVGKMATAFHNDSFKKNVEEQRDFEILFETITGQRADDEEEHNEAE